jgi:hypothetical protein
MNVDEFTNWVGTLTRLDLERIADALRTELDSADGEVSWWRATVTVSSCLRRNRCSRQAGMAAHHVTAAVRTAAERTGLLDDDRDAVTMLARAASEVARGLVAGDDAGWSLDALIAPWRTVGLTAA